MTELSNAVTVLIARMESHPEEFDRSAIDAPRFGYLTPYLTKLAGGGDELREHHAHAYIEEPFWFLNEADKEALIAAWKQCRYKAFEKSTMEKIFDDGEAEREAEMKKRVYAQQARQQVMNQAQNSALQGGNYNSGGLFGQGLFGQAQGVAIHSGASNPVTGMTISANGAVNMANTLSLGGETIDSSILKKLKDLVK